MKIMVKQARAHYRSYCGIRLSQAGTSQWRTQGMTRGKPPPRLLSHKVHRPRSTAAPQALLVMRYFRSKSQKLSSNAVRKRKENDDFADIFMIY